MKKFFTVIIIVFSFCFYYVNALEVDTVIDKDDSKVSITENSEETNFDITSNNVILYNLNDNNILYHKNSDDKVQIASLTKIMTAIVAIENIKDLNEEVIITGDMFVGIEEYAQAGLKVGDMVTYKDLLYGIILPSGADCVNAVVQSLGSEEEFIKLMNEKASSLGLLDTKFDNAIGMDSENNYSTASDLAKLLIYALKNETFKTIYTTKEYIIENLNLTLNSTLHSYGKSLDVSNITGAKSGFTDRAGLCLASIATVNDVDYLLIVLGSDARVRSNAIKDTVAIYNYYSSNYGYKTVVKKNQVLKKINVKWGKVKVYEIKSDADIELYLENNISKEDIEYSYDGIEELSYGIKKGTKLGTVSVKYNDNILTTFDVSLNEQLSYYHPVIYAIMIFALILMILSLIQIKKKKHRKSVIKS